MNTTELVDLITREFPGWNVERDGVGAKLWLGAGPAPFGHVEERTESWVAWSDGGSVRDFADPLDAAEYATGEVALSRRNKSPEPRKNFTAKPRIDLIPPGVLSRHVLPVLHDGAQKHGRDHWRKCTRREYALAATTHVLAYLDGEETDESGHAALAHAAADLLLGLGVES